MSARKSVIVQIQAHAEGGALGAQAQTHLAN